MEVPTLWSIPPVAVDATAPIMLWAPVQCIVWGQVHGGTSMILDRLRFYNDGAFLSSKSKCAPLLPLEVMIFSVYSVLLYPFITSSPPMIRVCRF